MIVGREETETMGTRTEIGILVVAYDHMQCQLLVTALRRRRRFRVTSCGVSMNVILSAIADSPIDVILLNADHSKFAGQDMANVRRLHRAHPNIAKVLLLGESSHDSVVNAFRSGVKGVFCFADSPFRLLCKCIQRVHEGQVWANSEQLRDLVEGLTQAASVRVVDSRGFRLLTPREEQLVAQVMAGLTNRKAACELGLTEHTVKKYMNHIFDKLGISTRVELAIYALSQGGVRPGWGQQTEEAVNVCVQDCPYNDGMYSSERPPNNRTQRCAP
jgi:two-component system, NarL family, nitrate/nitrite response regulator NarL